MEVHSALFHGQASPVFERERADEELDMLFTQLADDLAIGKWLSGLES